MTITRDGETGGHFSAPISLNVRLSFVPVSKASGPVREVFHQMRLGANVTAWSANLDKRYRGFRGPVVVDTDGDDVPDTAVPGTTPNFVAGLDALSNKLADNCHDEAAGIHCSVLSMPIIAE
jgi:hypothetical protein